jgi:hypothetical protein
MFKADIHLRPLHTSILNIYKVFETLVWCLKGIWLHPYTITMAKLPPDLGIHVCLRSRNDATTSWLRLTSNSDHFIHPYMTYRKIYDIGMLSQGQMVAPLYRYTGQDAHRFGDSGSLEELK